MDPLRRACYQGKTASNGGLSVGDLRNSLVVKYPAHEAQIRSGERKTVEALCRQLLEQKVSTEKATPSVPRGRKVKPFSKPPRREPLPKLHFATTVVPTTSPVPPQDVPCPSGKIEVLQEYNPYTFLVMKDGVKQVMKIITKDTHPWNATSSFKTYFKSEKHLLERISENYRLFDRLGFGQKVVEEWCPGNKLYLFLEYLPYRATEKLIKEHEQEIRTMIADLHRRGIVHGDLHGGNIMFDKHMKPVIIDLDTVFHLDELKENPLPMEWLKRGFDITDIDEYLWKEANENFQVVLDED